MYRFTVFHYGWQIRLIFLPRQAAANQPTDDAKLLNVRPLTVLYYFITSFPLPPPHMPPLCYRIHSSGKHIFALILETGIWASSASQTNNASSAFPLFDDILLLTSYRSLHYWAEHCWHTSSEHVCLNASKWPGQMAPPH